MKGILDPAACSSVSKAPDQPGKSILQGYIKRCISTISMASSSSRSQKSRPRLEAESTRSPLRNNPQLPASLRNPNLPASPYISPYAPITTQAPDAAPTIFSPQPTQPASIGTNPLLNDTFLKESRTGTGAMSTYSSSSQDSIYSSPGPQQYTMVTAGMMSNPRNISEVSQRKRRCMIS